MTTRLPDHYAALGVSDGASAAEIRAAYLAAARRCHPDKTAGGGAASADASSSAEFQQIQLAWEVLSDERARTEFDAARAAASAAASAAAVKREAAIADEIDADDMALVEASGAGSVDHLSHACRCGGAYTLPLAGLKGGARHLVECSSCSLRVRITVPADWDAS